MLARGSLQKPRFVRMIRFVHHDYPWLDEPGSLKLAHSTTMESVGAISRGAVTSDQVANLANPMRRTLNGLLPNQIGKRQRLIARLCDFEHMINHVLLQSNRLEL